MPTVAQTMQNIWNFMVGKSSPQEIATLAIVWEISDPNLETWIYGPIIWSLLDYPGKLTALHVNGYGTYPRLAVRFILTNRHLPMFYESKAWDFHLASDRGFRKRPINFGRFMLTSEHCRKCSKMFGRPMNNSEAIWKTTILACFDFVRTQSHYSAPFWNSNFCGSWMEFSSFIVC